MKKQNSAIMQMLLGKRGNVESVTYSEEYHKLLCIAVEKQEALQEKIKDNPELLKAFDEYMEAIENENTLYADESYREGFAFGLAMGQEVFDN